MEKQAYLSMGSEEDENWYYQARIEIIARLIRKYVVHSGVKLKIVDVGCGTGSSSIALKQFGDVVGVEPSSVALKILREKFPSLEVRQGAVEDIVSVVGLQSCDLVSALGVLYHAAVSDPARAVAQIASVLRSGGWFLWNDCIYPQLWREHDELVHAGRRFYPREMHEILEKNRFKVVHSSNLLAWGTPVAWALSLGYRLRNRVSGRRLVSQMHSDDRRMPGLLNKILKSLTIAEWRLAESGLRFPFGVSRMILAKKIE